ncbi:MAG: alpha-L-fucosidase [Sphingobacterium sp.]
MTRKTLVALFLLNPIFSFAQTPPEPYGALPSERQLRWHEMELYTLIHYTPTTFQDKEWGYGDADPEIFDPSGFDADQIASAAAAGGFRGLISVAKHHDGFCLWPTKTTDYSVESSPWKGGRGDMVKEFMRASHNHDLAFGVYLSAWDRNDTRYGSKAYADAYRKQLTELMTNYGPLFTSWHDGANGGDGYYGGKNEKRIIDRATYYEWHEKTWPIVRKLQPMAMIFSDVGPDMRWVGNEKGMAAETSWSTLTPKGLDGAEPVPGVVDNSNLPTGDRNGEYWIPAECDVPQRPGWFYHENQNDQVKTPNQLFEIYLNSVGRGGAMNLGLAPMPEGVLHDNDVQSLRAFGEKLEATFANDLAQGATAKASNVRQEHELFSENKIFDGDRYSYYAADDAVLNPTIEIDLAGEKEFDLIRLRENIKLGQRLDSVRIDSWEQGQWKRLSSATSIGAGRLIKLDQPTSTSKIRLSLYAPVAPTLSEFALFKEAPADFQFEKNERDKVDRKRMTIISNDKHVGQAIDGDQSTVWESHLAATGYIELKLENPQPVRGMSYLPRQDAEIAGVPTRYQVQVSADGEQWIQVAEGEFSNIRANATKQIIDFKEAAETQYIRFYPKAVLSENQEFSVAEFEIYR